MGFDSLLQTGSWQWSSGVGLGYEDAIGGSPTSNRFNRDHLILSYFFNCYSFQKEKST